MADKTDYWLVPQDISHLWASILPELTGAAERNASSLMRVSVLARDGLPDGIVAPSFHRLEPKSRGRLDARPWWSVIRRIISGASGQRSCMVEIFVILNESGQPVAWTAPDVKRRK